jgi:hypothetical protein
VTVEARRNITQSTKYKRDAKSRRDSAAPRCPATCTLLASRAWLVATPLSPPHGQKRCTDVQVPESNIAPQLLEGPQGPTFSRDQGLMLRILAGLLLQLGDRETATGTATSGNDSNVRTSANAPVASLLPDSLFWALQAADLRAATEQAALLDPRLSASSDVRVQVLAGAAASLAAQPHVGEHLREVLAKFDASASSSGGSPSAAAPQSTLCRVCRAPFSGLGDSTCPFCGAEIDTDVPADAIMDGDEGDNNSVNTYADADNWSMASGEDQGALDDEDVGRPVQTEAKPAPPPTASTSTDKICI